MNKYELYVFVSDRYIILFNILDRFAIFLTQYKYTHLGGKI